MERRRRRVLAGAASGLFAGLAGCLGGSTADGDADATTTQPATETATTDEPTTTDAATTDEPTTTDAETIDESTTASNTTQTTEGVGPATVQVRAHPELGDVLVGPDDRTLYMFDQDAQGEAASTCTDDCASTWPPLTVDGDATAGPGVTAELSTFERADGSTQVAANGWPLYYYAADGEPGDATGQGVGGVWWVLHADGAPVRSTGTTTDGPGYGY